MHVQQYEIDGTEIWKFLNDLTLQQLCSYDLRLEDLKNLVRENLVDHIPPSQRQVFQAKFISNKDSPCSGEELERLGRKLNQASDSVLEEAFDYVLDKVLLEVLFIAKSLLKDTASKFEMNIYYDNPNKLRPNDLHYQYSQMMRSSPLQMILSPETSEEIERLLINNNAQYSHRDFSNSQNTPNQICVHANNIQTILDAIGNNQIDLQHPTLSKFYKKLNKFRLSLSDEDHRRLFANQTKNAPGPFILSKEHAGGLFECASPILSHSQIRHIWGILDADDRKKYFIDDELAKDRPIRLKQSVTHTVLMEAAANSKHSITLLPSQSRHILSHMTLNQLRNHAKLEYKQGANTLENTLTSGSHYLSQQYNFSSNNLTQLISIVTAYAFRISMWIAGIIAFSISLIAGFSIALLSAYKAMRKESALRMLHAMNCLKLNETQAENSFELNRLNTEGLTETISGSSRYDQLLIIIERAGLNELFYEAITETQALSARSGFTPNAVLRTQVLQVNRLTDALREHTNLIHSQFQRLEERYKTPGNSLSERVTFSRQMAHLQQLSRYLEATKPHNYEPPEPNIGTVHPPAANLTQAARFKAKLKLPIRRLIHSMKPDNTGVSPFAQAILTGFFVTLGIVATAVLITSVMSIIVAVSIGGGLLGLVLGHIRFKAAKQEIEMKVIEKNSKIKLMNAQDEAKEITRFEDHCVSLRDLEQHPLGSAQFNRLKKEPSKIPQLELGNALDLEPNIACDENSNDTALVVKENLSLKQENAILREDFALVAEENLQQKEEIAQLRAQLAQQRAKQAAPKSPPAALLSPGQSRYRFMKAASAEELLDLGVEKNPTDATLIEPVLIKQ